MPVLTVYRHGSTCGVPPALNTHPRAIRGEVGGWSDRSTRSNQRFLYSVDERELSGEGWALSLTVRDCPPDHAAWHKLRRAFSKRLERMGMIRMHWLTEWQRRGCPHLHAAIWFPDGEGIGARDGILYHWVTLARVFGAKPQAQHIKPIHDDIGWFQYLSKHAVRGLKHYQRSAESIPEGWQKTGRMWGRWGDWPTVEGIRLSMAMPGFHAFRRIVRAWRKADARAAVTGSTSWKDERGQRFAFFDDQHRLRHLRRSGVLRRLQSARGMLRCTDPKLSAVRGVSEWLPIDITLDMLGQLHRLGFEVRS